MDLLYELAITIVVFMEASPGFPLFLLYIAIACIPMTFVHELGHGVAARRLLDTDVRVEVGRVGELARIRLGQIEATISALQPLAGVGGAATFDDSSATARDILRIALAGPLASLAATVVAALLYSSAPRDGAVHDLLWAAVLVGVFGVLNVIPVKYEERRNGPSVRSDGWLALDALRVVRALR